MTAMKARQLHVLDMVTLHGVLLRKQLNLVLRLLLFLVEMVMYMMQKVSILRKSGTSLLKSELRAMLS